MCLVKGGGALIRFTTIKLKQRKEGVNKLHEESFKKSPSYSLSGNQLEDAEV